MNMDGMDVMDVYPSRRDYLSITLKVVGILGLVSSIVLIFVLIGNIERFYSLANSAVLNITASGNYIVKDIHKIQIDITESVLLFKQLSNEGLNVTTVMLEYVKQITNDLNKIAQRIG